MLKGKKVLITGGNGFFGKHVVSKLNTYDLKDLYYPTSKQFDLTKKDEMYCMLESLRPDIVFHLAASVGGIEANLNNPAKFYFDNLIMGANIIDLCHYFKVSKLVNWGTVCSYPKFIPVPFKEDNLWDGYPEDSNAAYGLAKKMMIVQSAAYRKQYGFNSINLLPINMYGPGDNYDKKTSHVIPALIKKCVDAARLSLDEVIVWGDGLSTREFMYVDDSAEALILAAEKYNEPVPLNIGTGIETRIKDIAMLIARNTKFKGKITWDKAQPSGQPRRSLDISKMNKCLDYTPRTSLEIGIIKTIEDYINRF
jgi:GDP-L-fucose synthase